MLRSRYWFPLLLGGRVGSRQGIVPSRALTHSDLFKRHPQRTGNNGPYETHTQQQQTKNKNPNFRSVQREFQIRRSRPRQGIVVHS